MEVHMSQNDSVVIAYSLTPGELLQYRSTVATKQVIVENDEAPQVIESFLEIMMDQKITEVSNGVAKVEVTITDGSIRRGTDVLPLESVGQKLTMNMKRNGDIESTSVNFPFSQPAFPSQPLKPSDSWQTVNPISIPLNQNGAVKQVNLVYKHTFSRLDRKNGYDVAVIDISCPSVEMDLQEDVKQTITAEGCTYFAHTQGRLVGSSVHTHTEVKAPGAQVSTDITVGVELVNALIANGDADALPVSDEQFIIGT